MTEEIKEILKKTDIDAVSYGVIINYITNLQKESKNLKDTIKKDNHLLGCNFSKKDKYKQERDIYKQRNEKAVENAKEKIKRYESYIHDLKNGNYPSPTIRQERQELIFRIREQEDLLNILQGGDE